MTEIKIALEIVEEHYGPLAKVCLSILFLVRHRSHRESANT